MLHYHHLTLYRLGHGCNYHVIKAVFGVSKALASETISFVIQFMVVALYDWYVALPKTIEEWKEELKGIMENNSFPYIAE